MQVASTDDGHVAEREHLRSPRQGQVGVDGDPARAVGLGARCLGEQARERRGCDSGGPHLRPGSDVFAAAVPVLELDRALVDADHGRPQLGVTPSETSCRSRARARDLRKALSRRSPASTSRILAVRVSHPAVVPWQRVACELGDLAGHLDAGRAPPTTTNVSHACRSSASFRLRLPRRRSGSGRAGRVHRRATSARARTAPSRRGRSRSSWIRRRPRAVVFERGALAVRQAVDLHRPSTRSNPVTSPSST